ncbi:MAG: hypothetical protein P8K74_05005 [Flavobacteriaceae bacterium]|jgi:hypothetical protein|nr:hypothetical protein [Flavobacteriaceae bacterium]MDG2235575.1 hypothetical protein [Flavobacteriaceae bacterium]|tara:strand:- start:6137 stop:6814 length:678 start_codon:yes stop_codon:yes gene_type:complete
MTEKIKSALLKWAEKVINHQGQWDEEKTHQAIQNLYELSIIQKMLLEQESLDKNLWEKQQSQLSEVLKSFSGDPEKEIVKGEEFEVAPMMETIKNMVTEMPEPEAYEKLFETFEETPSFEPKKKENSVKQSKQEVETIPEIKNINDRFNKTLRIDLNDRLAFIKNLFEGDTASYEKVLSQIVTFESWEEVFNFIDVQVKTEYDNWNKNEEIADRFLAILQKNFDR